MPRFTARWEGGEELPNIVQSSVIILMDGFKTIFRESSISRDLCNEAVECNGVLEPLRSNLIESNAITASRSAVDERLHKELGNPTGPVQRFSNLERNHRYGSGRGACSNADRRSASWA